MIIGLTGTNAAGKGTVVDQLVKEGFQHFSVRDFLTSKLKNEGKEVNRTNMINLANQLREQNGPSYITDRLYANAQERGGNAVIESICCPGEVESLAKQRNFLLFAIDADIEKRYQRSATRQSVTDGGTLDDFKKIEKLEMAQKNPWKQNLSVCMNLADVILFNNGTLEQFVEKVVKHSDFDSQEFLKRRPTYAEIFMNEAYTWAARSTCRRRKVGAAISSAENVGISQGYNGSARGDDNCIDFDFCVREKEKIPSGQQLEKCCAVHAEANAIINAGLEGRSVRGATLYGTTYPCTLCTGLIINAKIKRMVYDAAYNNPDSERRFAKSGIILERFEGVRSQAFDRLFRQK